jgi:hypothetical protein
VGERVHHSGIKVDISFYMQHVATSAARHKLELPSLYNRRIECTLQFGRGLHATLCRRSTRRRLRSGTCLRHCSRREFAVCDWLAFRLVFTDDCRDDENDQEHYTAGTKTAHLDGFSGRHVATRRRVRLPQRRIHFQRHHSPRYVARSPPMARRPRRVRIALPLPARICLTFFHSAATCLHEPARLTREPPEARGAEAPGQRTARGRLL